MFNSFFVLKEQHLKKYLASYVDHEHGTVRRDEMRYYKNSNSFFRPKKRYFIFLTSDSDKEVLKSNFIKFMGGVNIRDVKDKSVSATIFSNVRLTTSRKHTSGC